LRRAKRCPNDLNAVASEYVIKPVRELLITITNQKPNPFGAVRQRPRQLASLLDNP